MDLIRRLVGPRALAAIVLLGVAVAGCTRPVYNVSSEPIETPLGQASTAEVRAAILEAATARGWTVKEDVAGRIQLAIDARSHSATVNVDYTQTSYDIVYYDSKNLDYDGTNIHRNYNKWIKLLEQDINKRLRTS